MNEFLDVSSSLATRARFGRAGRRRLPERLVARYVGLTFATTWLLWAPLVLFGDRVPAPAAAAGLTMAGSLVPSAAAILVLSVTNGRPALRDLRTRLLRVRVGFRWYAGVFLLPLLVPVAVVLSVLVGGDAPDVDATALSIMLLFVVSIFPGSALGEELGWRGLLLPRLLTRRSALTASLTVGAVWGIWHLPLWLTGDDSRPVTVFPIFLVSTVAISVIMTWMHQGTDGSLFVIVLYHAAANLPLSLLVAPLGSAMMLPFAIYAALAVSAAVGIVLVDGPRTWTRAPTLPKGHRYAPSIRTSGHRSPCPEDDEATTEATRLHPPSRQFTTQQGEHK